MMLKKALHKHAIPFVVASLGIALATVPALADQIDGDWCNAEGENLRIDGPAIKTPGGVSMTGEYDRHHFSYVSPPGEKHAGETLNMTQHSDELMTMRLPDGSYVSWRRCEVIS